MAAIFQFFHNGQHWYSISVNTWKTKDPNFWGDGNLKFFRMIDINKMAAIFQFFIMADTDIQFTLGKLEMWIFCWFSFPNFQLVQFSSSPILGSVSTLMHGYA